jgi:hypothetical protein
LSSLLSDGGGVIGHVLRGAGVAKHRVESHELLCGAMVTFDALRTVFGVVEGVSQLGDGGFEKSDPLSEEVSTLDREIDGR